MMDQELLHDFTESYLKAVVSEASDRLRGDFDSRAAFGELGIDSFQVLKIIKKLEGDFGPLPKSLLFEKFNIHDLAGYFAEKHEKTLSARFAEKLRGAVVPAQRPRAQTAAAREDAGSAPARSATPILIRETDAHASPELKDLVGTLYARYKIEGCVSRGTRVIAPNLFIGSERRGYFNYGRTRDILLLYGYTGPRDYVPALLQEVYGHCAARGLQLNVLTADPIPDVSGTPFSATPFGVLQRIPNLKSFSLDGGAMRRLRYQVSKFEKSGACRTEEYRPGSSADADRTIAGVIDRWCESRTVVNPLVPIFKAEVLAGTVDAEHRLFLTWLNDVLQNVVLITPMCAEENGYLMDLEFYLPEMPMGGLEFAIAGIIARLASEGCDVLSLGGTYGCKLEPSPTADPEIDAILDDLRAQNIFNDGGNLQFKNKFRPENRPIFLCRPVGSGNPGNVIDIIMMIADPSRTQTADEGPPLAAAVPVEAARESSEAFPAPTAGPEAAGGDERSRVLAAAGFNPLNVAHEHVGLDLMTDSWAQLHMPAIDAQMRHLHSRLQDPVNVDAVLRSVFPFPHFVLTSSGQAAESILFKAWPERGIVPQNLLFPTTILHQIDNGFTPKELPHPALFEANSPEPFKGNLNLDALRAVVADDPGAIACVCIDVGNNGSGGHAVSTRHLRDVKACLAPHAIPLVIDATRVVQNALFLVDREKEHAGKSVWAVVQEILSHADVVFASLTKEFCVDKGGLVAVRDAALFRTLLELADREGAGLDLIEKRLIALSLQNRGNVEAKVARKTEGARLLATALSDRGVPVVHAGGGHCVLIDVKRIPEFRTLKNPVASFLAWVYGETGIRGGAHSVGMLKQTAMNDLVRLAIPAGLPHEAIESAIEWLGAAFANKVNIPELVSGGGETSPAAGVHARYRLEGIRNATAKDSAESSAVRPNRERNAADPVPAEAQSPRTVSKAGPGTGDIAVVGMAGRYPKAKNVAELWENLAGGRDCVEEIPPDRLERRRRHGSTAKYRGGFLDDVDRFDSLFFNISPREAEVMDPQERLFLEVAWEAIEDAGYYPEVLAHEDEPRDIGVFVGAVWGMYQIVGVDEQRAGNHVAPNSFLWSIANRVSYWMNLSGPSLTVDTACSSSLTALYLACEAIQAGDCSAAIVGGVNLDLHQAKLDINLIGGALSPDGVCRTFGKGANGYVAGEGVGALLLKPLDRALRDGDQVYGVIRSAVVNHGGRTSGYFVPNPAAQTNVISAALRKANVGPRTIGYVEAHGTGTELGDPLEIAGLSAAFGVDDVGRQSCAIGSIKTNIGHLEAAAGIVGMTKVLLQMKHRRLVPSLHSSEPNEFIDFEHSPFYVVQKLEEWEAKELDGVRVPLRAGISSFGAGGANAHVILESLESHATEEEEPAEPPDLIFPLSARNEDQLREAAVRLVEFLRRTDARAKDVAHTLQYGRKSFEHRLAVVARTTSELIEKLTRFVDGKKDESVVLGDVKRAEGVTRLLNRSERQEFVRLLSHGSDPRRIAALWVEGLLADWQGFESSVAGRRISLPTYPFAGKRHWIGGTPASVPSAALQPVAGMHPMVDSNESTFERQLFKKTFHDRDFFIYDHMVSDIPTLPGVAYLELVRKAGEVAAGMPVRRIQNILWVSPIAVRGSVPQEVFVELKPNGDAVQFEVFSDTDGNRTLHSQGKLLYTNRDDGEPESVDLDAIRARCTKGLDGKDAYPLFKSFGLDLGPSFQVLEEVYRNDEEALGVLALPEFRRSDLQNMVLHPSLVDGSMQAGMAARLGDDAGEMLVPYSIGEVEILHPLPANCLSYTTQAKDGRKDSRVLKSNVLILDATGKVLARIRESTGVPILDVHKKSETHAGTPGVSRLHYAYDWEKAPPPAEPSSRYVPQAILLFGNDELRVEYQAGLDRVGARSTRLLLVRPGAEFRRIDEQTFEIDPRRADDFARLLETLVERAWPIEDICFAWPAVRPAASEDDVLQQSLERGVHAFLFLCQGLIQAKLERAVQLLCLYAPTAAEIQPQDEGLTGFVNTLHNEHPKLLCKTVEIRAESSRAFDAVWAELCARIQDAVVVRHDAGERSVRKLKAFELETADGPSRLRENGVYLITGGAGGLGLLFAEFLARRYKARLVLTGRSTLSDERQNRLQELRNAGADVVYRVADVSRREDVESVVREARSRFGSIHGIIHSAGVVRDSYIRNKTPDEMAAVFAPKVLGTLNLDDATREDALDLFVTFSSLAAVTGNPGQSDYAFANAFMDSFAAERERLRRAGMRSGKSLSFNWSLWADGGMRPDEQTQLALRKTLGMELLSTEAGLDAFVRGLASERTSFAVVEGAQEKLETAWGLRTKPTPAAAPASSTEAIASPLPADREGSLRPWLQDELSQIVMRLLKLDAGDISPDKILMDLGFDSIGLTTFANAVNDRFQLDITPVLFFDYPSIEEIAKYLAEDRSAELVRFHRANDASTGTTAAPATQQQPNAAEGQDGRSPAFEIRKGWSPPAADRGDSTAISARGGYSPELRFVENPIAIVGMSGVMPQSEDLDEFWEHLKSSRDLVTLIPPDRWRWEDYYGDPLKEANKSNSKWGAFMREIDKFDPLFFGISPREAQMMDPQQRIFLEHVWKAIEDAGEKVSSLSGTKTGVFVGVATNDYLDVMSALGTVLDGYSASGNSHSVLANRVSFLLGLRGPSAPLDTACSSSLVALHRALESIHTGSCEMAIVGGVQVMLSPAAYISFSSAGMLSPDGKCKTFDKSANGYVRGEGCGAIFLKSLAKAEADGNHIYAVVRATAENHGGRVTAMTAPNPSAQTELLIEAYEKGHVDPSTVGFIECHGTGTSLGDPIETQALGKAFAELYRRNGKAPAETPHVALSSVKTNIGHLETAAGIAGIIKALLAIRHRRIPANIHLEEVNPYISLKGTPFFIAKELTPWDAPVGADGLPGPRRAGVSSFGFGGANAHVVLEEYIPRARRSPAGEEPRLIVLSAKNGDRLKDYVRSLRAHLEKADIDLLDLAYTLQVGRDEMPERLALVVSSTEELKRELDGFLHSGDTPRSGHRNNVRNKPAGSAEGDGAGRETLVRSLLEEKDLPKLGELWTAGAQIDWRALYVSEEPRRVSAPTYPFARDRYWIPAGGTKAAAEPLQSAAGDVARLHPLVHRNVSTLAEQKFASRFTGAEFFLADHSTATHAVLPAAAHIEMVSVAGEIAAEQQVRSIRNMALVTPLTVQRDAVDVEVLLVPVGAEVDFTVTTKGAGEPVVHSRGKLVYASATVSGKTASPGPASLDIAAIRERCTEAFIPGSDLYPFLCTSALQFGPGFRVVQEVRASQTECLAVLQLPEHLRADADRFRLHPVLLDGGMHTAIGLVKRNRPAVPWSLPYSVGEVQIYGSLRDVRYVHATWDLDNVRDEHSLIRIHLAFAGKDGACLVRVRDLVARPFVEPAAKTKATDAAQTTETRAALESLVPIWSRARVDESRQHDLPDPAGLLLLGSDPATRDWVLASFPAAQFLDVSTADPDTIGSELAARRFDHLLWAAPDLTQDSLESIIAEQERGVLAVFRIVKGLLHTGFGNKSLQWTILTRGTQQVTESEPIRPAHAGIAGLVGSLAKEYPHWDLRLLDLDSVDAVTARDCLALPCDKLGNALAHRRGEWFRQSLALLETPPPVTTDYREGGVYVVIGGAGGVGEVWTRFMIEHYHAHVVWIGRREIDDAIRKKIDDLSRLGPAPLYVTADARDADALENARQRILRTYPAIHGVVHSAIVLDDQSIGRMEEAAFRAGLSAKVDVSVNMAGVFGRDALDLMLFFSSIVSFVKSPGQSNYSAGCTFKDAFAQSLRQRRSHPVKVMNWGYWGNVGVVADESYNRAMAQMGIGSIEPEEGMAALQRLAGSDLSQLVVLKTLNSQPLAALNVSEAVSCQSDAPAILPAVEGDLAEKRVGHATGALEAGLPTPDMIDLATRILAASLVSVGLFRDGVREIAQLSLESPPAPYYERWLRSSVRHLQERDILGGDLALRGEAGVLSDLWLEWEARSAQWMASSSVQAQVTLLGACLKALPGILTGKQFATDVMFPSSSVALVEGIYRGNPLADHFNDVLAATLVACVEQLLAGDGTRALRILEIGAGTGGTTAKLLPILRPYAIEEYRYTDISKAFLLYAEKQFGRDFPALKTAIFDVTKPLAAQTITPAHYDIVIAANVLHATPDIRETVRNAKATLRNQGVLLLNEISTWSLFTHLTFGLLEGWWLHEDTAVRLQGSPALAPDRWRELLAAEGFPTILFPAESAHEYGQQIIAAASDGRTRQRTARRAALSPAAPEPSPEKVRSSAPRQTPRGDATAPASAERKEQMISEHVRRVITDRLAESLRMDAAMIRGDEPFADYGVDSIIGVNLVRTINEALQIELETTSLFEYSTVNDLTAHVLRNWSEPIAGRIAPAAGIASEPAPAAAVAPPDSREETPPRFTGATRFAAAASTVIDAGGADRAGFGAEPIAVIGMSGRFAQSDSLDAFWENLAEGKDLVTTVSRWSAGDCVIPGTVDHAYSSHGSFIDSIDLFDRAFFGISAEEATCMDPQQRLFLEESWKALEDAGYAGKRVQETQCGVYVGCGSSKYDLLFAGDQPAQAFWGNSESVIPARIAYHLDLHGPAVAIDTACSSSLVAIHLACQGLWTRETEMALAGGVFLQPTPSFYQVANRAGMLSPDGKCYSFDARANGFVPGEGVGVVVLKRLKDALSDGDHIHGVIVGSGINQDGRSNGLTAPNGRAQERLERSVYERFGIHPETIQLLEAHGTGTLLGDSIEYGAITRSFRQQTQKRGFCALGTVKTNIGHAATAAGIAGVLKVLLALKHRRIPPSLHFERSNPGIDLDSGPFHVNSRLCEWEAGEDGVRRAAVSAFGFSGTNAHLVIEAPPAADRCTVEAPAYLVALSARTAGQLRLQVENLLGRLRSAPGISMNDLSFSLVAGRMHLSHRLACVARSQDELIQSLEQWLQTGDASRVHAAEVPQSGTREQASLRRFGTFCIQECREAASADTYEENLSAIAELHVQGYSLDLAALFAGESHRIPLPTYPFARERYWVDSVPSVRPEVPLAPVRLQIAATPAESEVEWLFSRNGGMAPDSMAPAEKMELFLRQEAALQLKKPIDEIPSDRTFFDLGMSSLGMTHLVQNIGRLLDENLSPGVLFDYSDIRSLAAFLAQTYPAGVRAVTALRAGDGHRAQQIACPEPQEVRSSAAASSAALSVDQILESISWQSALVADGYEKVTF